MTRHRARVEWPGKEPLRVASLEVIQDTGRNGLPQWRAVFTAPVDALRHVELNSETIQVALDDGRAGEALLSDMKVHSNGIIVHLVGAGALA
jgi:hypothetical protein